MLLYPMFQQLDGSDESSSYGAIGDSTAKTEWNEGSKVFDRHLDFTLDGNRAERLGRVIAKAKRKRQWCRGLTAIFGLVFFVLSVVVVSLSVTRGRKVFGSMWKEMIGSRSNEKKYANVLEELDNGLCLAASIFTIHDWLLIYDPRV